MKTVKEFISEKGNKIKYVIPETEEERLDIERILKRDEEEEREDKPLDPSKFTLVDNRPKETLTHKAV